jgi:CspA family cold shock protein
MESTKTGKVKFFNQSKNWGFLVDDADGKEYFVHVSDTITPIQDNDSVSFQLKDGKRGTKAVNVKKI